MKYRMLWAAAVAGLAIHFAGLGWDVYRHSADSTLAQREDVLSLANPSHLMLVVGMAIVAASLLGIAALWMQDHQFGGSGFAGATLRSLTVPVIGVVAAGSVWLASRAEDQSDHHGGAMVADHPHADGVTGDHPHDSSGPGTQDAAVFVLARAQSGSALSADGHNHGNEANAESDAMGEGNKHTHGVEVNATGEQLLAAGLFAQEVKAKTAKYADVRDALAEGYLQVTPDLPGIAAHFVRLDYRSDGHEMNPERPEVLLYSKRLDGNWRLVGVMFMQEGPISETPPSYFGPLDVWHRHDNLCFLSGARVKTVASAAECVGGAFQARGAYQMHVWVEPGGAGVFAHDYSPISPGAFPAAVAPAAQELRVQAR
jgi:hypothetical protein